jgi:hypothetical protein
MKGMIGVDGTRSCPLSKVMRSPCEGTVAKR